MKFSGGKDWEKIKMEDTKKMQKKANKKQTEKTVASI